jgi:hypothetical protein
MVCKGSRRRTGSRTSHVVEALVLRRLLQVVHQALHRAGCCNRLGCLFICTPHNRRQSGLRLVSSSQLATQQVRGWAGKDEHTGASWRMYGAQHDKAIANSKPASLGLRYTPIA